MKVKKLKCKNPESIPSTEFTVNEKMKTNELGISLNDKKEYSIHPSLSLYIKKTNTHTHTIKYKYMHIIYISRKSIIKHLSQKE